jgi:hypothetical protein
VTRKKRLRDQRPSAFVSFSSQTYADCSHRYRPAIVRGFRRSDREPMDPLDELLYPRVLCPWAQTRRSRPCDDAACRAGDSGPGALAKRRERKMQKSRSLGLGRRRRPCGQLNDFVCCFNAVIHRYPDYRVAFLDHHSSRFGSFSRRVRPLRLPIHLEQESADLGSLALREHFLHHLWRRFLCFAQFDYSRCHSVLVPAQK